MMRLRFRCCVPRSMGVVFFGFLLLFVTGCSRPGPREILEISFSSESQGIRRNNLPVDSNGVGKTLTRSGLLYTMVFNGDYSQLLRMGEMRSRMQTGTPGMDESAEKKVSCTVFMAAGEDSPPRIGRNFDNRGCDLLVTLCLPPRGYASLGFSTLRNLGFKPGDDLKSVPLARLVSLMYLPYLTPEGINEKGVFAALTYVGGTAVSRNPPQPARFVTHWVREVLDHASDLDEAIRIATSFQVYDNGMNFLSHNLFVADASGRSAVVEYNRGQWRVIRSSENWQVLTNFRQWEMSESRRRRRCKRYRRAMERLESAHGRMDEETGMALLRRVSQRGKNRDTQWSWLADPSSRSVLLRLRRDNRRYYRLRFPAIDGDKASLP